MRNLSYEVLPGDSGKYLRDILKKRLFVSSSLLSELKRKENGILLNGVPVYVSAKVETGDLVSIELSDDSPSEGIVPRKGALKIRYEDSDLLVIEKDANTPVHPSQGHFEDTLANFVRFHMESRGESFVYRPVNRLDKDTTGLMIIAKNSYAHTRLISQMKTTFTRRYLAIASGYISEDFGMISKKISRVPGEVLRREVSSTGKDALTVYEKLFAREEMTLLRLKLFTGRTHQIRVHLASIGHPLLGDFLYGREEKKIPRQMLHSSELYFLHPISGKEFFFSSPPPPDMEKVLQG